jgi:hypothetical protein
MVRIPLFRTDASWFETIRATVIACIAIVVASFIPSDPLAVLLVVAAFGYVIVALRPRRW